MPYSEVPRIELNRDGTVTFYVNIGGFRKDTPVEISCYASQTNGTTATFRDVQPMPAESGPGEGAIVAVTRVPVIGPGFTGQDPIMVVASAADVWITKLDQDMGDTEPSPAMTEARALHGQVNLRAAWNSDGATYHSMYAPAAAPGQPGPMWQKAPEPPAAAEPPASPSADSPSA